MRKVKLILMIFAMAMQVGCTPNTTQETSAETETPAPVAIATETPMETPEPTATPAQTVTAKELTNAEAYIAVLQNEIEFYTPYGHEKVYFKDCNYILYNGEDLSAELEFAVVDMDGDGLTEVVLNNNNGGGHYYTWLLHFEDGVVYSYDFGIRNMYNIKKDGSFSWTSYTGEYLWYGNAKIKFSGTETEWTDLDNYKEIFDEEGNWLESLYFIDEVPVTEEEINLYNEQYGEKEDVVWYAFTESNIRTQIIDEKP